MSLNYEVDFESVPEDRYDVGSSFETQSIQTRPRTIGNDVTLEEGHLDRVEELFEEIKKNGLLEALVPRRYREAITELHAAKSGKNVLTWDVRLKKDRGTLLRLHVGKSTVSMGTSHDSGDVTFLVNVKEVSVHHSVVVR